ncbi:MAG: phage regulatory protein/antirepressor Ant, partial [Fusobacteriaceae bacterium]
MELTIKNVNGFKVAMTSLQIAELTGKLHANIIRDIEDETNKLGVEIAGIIFEVSSYKDKNNQSRKMYNLTRDGAMQLGARYDAVTRFKMIQRINELEQVLVTKTDSYMIQDPIERAKAWIVEAEEKKELELKVEEAKPKVVYYDKVLNSEKLITVTDIAKDFGMSAIKLNSFLQEIGVQYKKSGSWKLYANHENKVPEYADYVINEYGQSLRWTELGRQWILELIATKNNVNKIGSIA